MPDAVELLLPPDTQHVSIARLIVVTAARRAGMDEGRVQDLRLAVSEVMSNVILAHQQTDSRERVTLRLWDSGDGIFQVTVADAAPGMATHAVEDGLESLWPGEDLSARLIEGLADEVELTRDDGRLQLRFSIRLADDD